MDWLQFSASVIGSLAWPIAVVVLGTMFREQFKALLAKLRHAKGAGIEVDFAEDLKRVVAEGEQVKQEALAIPEPLDGMGLPAPNAAQQREELYALLRERPSALILDSWRDVEKAAHDVIAALGLQGGSTFRRGSAPANWATLLQTQGVLTEEQAALLADLRRLRNKVAHAVDWEPAVPDALDYHRTASLLTSVLRLKFREIAELKK
jgi:hypothetical protein